MRRLVAICVLVLGLGAVARADHPAREPLVGVELGVASGPERAVHGGGWVGVDVTRRLAVLAFLDSSWFDRGQENALGGGVRVWPWSRLYLEARAGYLVELRDHVAGAVHDGRLPLCDDHESACGWLAGGTLGVEVLRGDGLVLDLRLDAAHADAAALSRDTVGLALAVDVY